MTGSVSGGSAAMAVALCTAACQAKNFLYAGLEYSQECWCGNAILNGNSSQKEGSKIDMLMGLQEAHQPPQDAR